MGRFPFARNMVESLAKRQRVGRVADNASVVRDFFYLDVDRVRSLLAQLREGVPSAFEKTRS